MKGGDFNMNKLTTHVVHLHDVGQYECRLCGTRNTGIAGEVICLNNTGVYNVYQGYCENNCDFTMDMWGDI